MSSDQNTHQMALPTGYQLEQYRIEAQLGHGGFGITYRALDTRLDRQVAIKEYLPRDLAFRNSGQTVQAISQSDHEMFEWGLERFLDEARTLAKFNHPNIVRVLQFFRANDTAYLVMEYCDGEPLDRILQREGRLQPDQVLQITNSLLDALNEFHKLDVIHRDIKPANIYIRSDGTPVLLDFGSARQAVVGRSRSMTSVISPHYAAFEQYSSRGKQGPWTDVYGLGATIYHAITGTRPPESIDRVHEDCLEALPNSNINSVYEELFLSAINKSLEVVPNNRIQSAARWKETISITSKEPIDINTGASTLAAKFELNQNDIPTIEILSNPERDPFETDLEYEERIRQHIEIIKHRRWYIGKTVPNKNNYNINKKCFYIKVFDSPAWARSFTSNADLFLELDRDSARDLCKMSGEICLHAYAAYDGNGNFYPVGPMLCTSPEIHVKHEFFSDRYETNDNGVVIDKNSKLAWQRFCVGQRWINNNPKGKPESYSWHTASKLGEKSIMGIFTLGKSDSWNYASNFLGFNDWRLPTDEELLTLIKFQAETASVSGFSNDGVYSPTHLFNLSFPETPQGNFWTSISIANNNALISDDEAVEISFGDGTTKISQKNSDSFVRLVRTFDAS